LVVQIKNKINKMKKLNLEKLAELELTHKDNKISLKTLQRMVNVVVNNKQSYSPGAKLAEETLVDLGILINDKKVEQLNS